MVRVANGLAEKRAAAGWGRACPEGWPGDAIDRIDATDEVGRGGAMLNAEC